MTLSLMYYGFLQIINRYVRHSRLKLGLWYVVMEMAFVVISWRVSGVSLRHMSLHQKIGITIVLTSLTIFSTSVERVYKYVIANHELRWLGHLGVADRHVLRAAVFRIFLQQVASSVVFLSVFSYGVTALQLA